MHYDIVLRGWKVSESFKHALNNKIDYVNFGTLAFALEIIPIVNIFFTWSNIIATALWVGDEYRLEKGLVQSKVNDKNQITPAAALPSASSKNDEENAPLLGSSSNNTNYS